MIYTVGHGGHKSAASLIQVIDDLGIKTLIDVRSQPRSRWQPWANRAALSQALGARYEWRGDVLGGLGAGVDPLAVDALRGLSGNVALMCAEKAPGDCHRHHAIGLPLARVGVDVMHVFERELIEATELQAAIDEGRDYDCSTF